MTGITEFAGAGDLTPTDAAARRTARFGMFELDLRSGELRRSGVKVKLQEQPLRVLLYLIERPGEVVTREELREHLWPDEFVDFDHSLNTAIRKLRTALDDSADNPRFVETLARRGYRFIAPVVWDGASNAQASATAPAASVSSGIAARPSRLPRIAAAIAFVVVTLSVIGAFIVSRGEEPAAPVAPDITSVAVLPFTNNDTWSEHVSDGLAEILIDTLSPVPGLRVMARTTVFEYKGKQLDPRAIGKELNVGSVVMGDVRSERDRYTIRVELVDATDGTQIWGGRFIANHNDLAAVQSRISAELARQMRRGSRGFESRPYTRSAAAYDLYLKGLFSWNKRAPEELKKALQYFTEATEADPSFAAAYSGIANTYGVMTGYGLISAEDGIKRVNAAAERALELDPANAEAYVSLATTKYRNLWDFEGAARDYARALALNPNYATGHQWYADFLRSMGRFEEARREVELAYKLDPLSGAINATMCWHYYLDRRYEEAIAFSERVSMLDRRFSSPPCVGQSLMKLGEFDRLATMMEQQTAEAPRAMAAAYRRGGKKALLEKSLELRQSSHALIRYTPVDTARIYTMLGDKDKAFHFLEAAYDERVSRLTSFHIDPAFDDLRGDPRFASLVKRIGLPLVEPPARK